MPKYSIFENVRILDLSQALSGPFATQILADLGAEVIKIEAPGVGDQARETTPRVKDDGYYFLALNRNKKSITLDLQTRSGKQAFLELVKISDVVFDNMRQRGRKHLGITYEELRGINPKIISASLTGFGTSGEYRDRSSFDDVGQAMSGISSLTTDNDGVPVRTGVGSADISAAVFSVIGIVSALYKREKMGEGSAIEVNMLDTCLSFIPQMFQYYFVTGNLPPRMGTKHPAIAGFGFFKTSNGYIAIGPSWPRIARAVNRENLIDDPRFKDPNARRLHKDELNTEIETALSEADTEDWMNIMVVEDIPAGPVEDLSQVETDPQVIHNKMIRKIRDPRRGELKVIDCPIKIPNLAEEDHLAPPQLGEHTDKVLREFLNYSEEDLARLKEEMEAHTDELLKTSVRRAI